VSDSLPPFNDDLKLTDLLYSSTRKELYGNLTQIGAGSTGVIYLADDRQTGKKVGMFGDFGLVLFMFVLVRDVGVGLLAVRVCVFVEYAIF
jgi:hypothetical protein